MIKKLLFIFSIQFATLGAFAQDKIIFYYDSAGNQVKRELICINCVGVTGYDFLLEEPQVKAALAEETIDELLEKEATVTYYPNPTREDLHIDWENRPNAIVQKIEVFTMAGQYISNYPHLAQQTQKIIPFRSLPSGLYHVILHYSDGKRKTLRIIKK